MHAASAGNLTIDPVLRTFGAGRQLVRLTVACDDGFRNKAGAWVQRPTQFVNVEAWDRLAQDIAATLRKGDPVVFIGSWRANEYQGQDGTTKRYQVVVADHLGRALGGKLAGRDAAAQDTEQDDGAVQDAGAGQGDDAGARPVAAEQDDDFYAGVR